MVKGSADYYPFGSQFPDRKDLDYRYAYQGQEKDAETGIEAFELRLWDSRIGRWLTPDPMGQHASPYLGMGNNPIRRIDPDGGKDDTFYKNKETGETVEVQDGVDVTLEVSQEDFYVAQMYAALINPSDNEGGMATSNIANVEVNNSYIDFYHEQLWNQSAQDFGWGKMLYYKFHETPRLITQTYVGGAGSIEFVSGPIKGLKYGGKIITQIQKHHLIPQALFEKMPVLSKYILRNASYNLKKLPNRFHGNHPAYSKWIEKEIGKLAEKGMFNEKGLRGLIKDANQHINKAYKEFEVSGQNLNQYFKNLNN